MPHDERPTKRATSPGGSIPSRLSALLHELAAWPEVDGAPPMAANLLPGARVGRFELVREIGRGGFGVVYEARDPELGRNVALKLVRPGVRPGHHEEYLLREAEAAAGLSHPNIITLHDAGRSELGPYLVFELLHGQTLARRLSQGRLPLREALRIAVEVARGLAHAHATGIVHRDLKPGNVFLCDGAAVKLLDLGLAHAFGRRRQDGGTPGYMAPEQVRGAPEDERTDVFALGVILHRLLAGALPFPEGRAPAGAPPLLDVPGAPALGELVARMLDTDPVKRPRDAGEVLPALLAFAQELERTPVADQVARTRRLGRRLRRRLALGTVVALAVVAGAAGLLRRYVLAPPPAAPSIAVLPFADLSPNRDQEYFSDGLADEILGALSRVEGLRVPGRTSSFYFKGKSAKLADIGRELGVAAVLEGSVRIFGNRARVTAQVVSVADGYRQWSATYDRELTDILAVQDEIARAVVHALGMRLAVERTPAARNTVDPRAYALYLVGRQNYHLLTQAGFQRAVEAYESALRSDPQFAPAWAGMAMPLYYLAVWEAGAEAAREMRVRARAAAEHAVQLSPDLPEALAARGMLRAIIDNEWEGALADLSQAIRLNGSDADTRRRHAYVLLCVGRLPEALSEVRRSIDLDPLGHAWIGLGNIQQDAGELAQAEAAFRRYMEIMPDSSDSLDGLGRNLLLRGRTVEALETFGRVPEERLRLWGRAAAQHQGGQAAAAREAFDALVRSYGETDALLVAEQHAWRGDREAALDWLERAHARREGSVTGEIAFDPFLARLRDHPRFQALLKSLRLPPVPSPPAPPK